METDHKMDTVPAPLEGIRVADFSWVIAGPYCTEHLTLLGAEVIKIESSIHMDISRRIPPFADGVAGEERSGHNHSYNLGKKSITLNLANPEAQKLALEIVRNCDIVVENFSYGILEKFNLGYEQLRAVNPNIILVTSAGLGRSGPYRRYVTWGPPLQAYAGIASITGQDGGSPERSLGGMWADHLSGFTSFFGALVALEARERHGVGQMVEYSMAEAVAAQMPEAFAEYGCTGVPPGPRGNRHPGACPHGIYPTEGEDSWVAIAILTDEDWLAFRDVVTDPPSWWLSEELEMLEGRLAREAEISSVVGDWTNSHTAGEVADILRAKGLSAGPVQSIYELAEDPILVERGFFQHHDHPEVGARRVCGIGWDALNWAPDVPRPPLLGEHSWEVFVEWLGLPPEEFARLVGDEAIV